MQAQQAVSTVRPLVVIDFELVFDVWSLLCCSVRATSSAQTRFPTQQIYPNLFHKPVQQAISEYSSEDATVILDSFKRFAPSVKPWIPMYQLM